MAGLLTGPRHQAYAPDAVKSGMKRVISSCARPWLAAIVLCCCAIAAPGVSLAAADVRILIDVSGSMKQNDPRNLRVPAMRLVSELLPQGTRAGVWLFAENAQTLIEATTVDEQWRKAARERLPEIHSRGLFTHIEHAIDAATAGWESEPDPGERHIVLLTDGMVDVSSNAAESAASRARILAGQLQRLRSYGAQVHAVALSENVDRELIEVLTSTTGGLLESASDAERLQRIFLHMLEQTAAPVTVPLEGKQFDIDASVSELTLLIFRNDGEAVQLIQPDGAVLTATAATAGVAWRNEAAYDLITVTAPAAGKWRFEGAEDPDNRAVVVTDLAMDMVPVPGSMLASEVVDLNAWMTEHGAPLMRTDLLELITAQVRIESDEMAAVHGAMKLNSETAQFESRLDGRALPSGDYRLTVMLDSGTFKRELNRRVRFLADPVSVQYAEQPGETTTIVVDVIADPEATDIASLSGYVVATDSAGLVRAFPLPKVESGPARVLVEATAPGPLLFAPNVYFTTRHGRSLHLEPAPQTFDVAFATPPSTLAEAVVELPTAEPVSWLHVAAWVALANLVIALGFAAIWWLYRSPRPVATTPTPASEAAPA